MIFSVAVQLDSPVSGWNPSDHYLVEASSSEEAENFIKELRGEECEFLSTEEFQTYNPEKHMPLRYASLAR